jgi:hypothetical protein
MTNEYTELQRGFWDFFQFAVFFLGLILASIGVVIVSHTLALIGLLLKLIAVGYFLTRSPAGTE